MRHMLDENAKKRLTDRGQLAVAVDFMMSHGFDADEVAVQLARYYYIDIDLLNEVLAENPEPVVLPQPSEIIWKDVA